MASITLVFSDESEIIAGSPAYSTNYTFRPGDKCKVKSSEFQQYRIGEFVGIRCSNSTTYVKFHDVYKEVYFTDIIPINY
ncbi:hypothetical protein [Nostoc sp. LPT]|uniref:hypothetical protein n=1 Tax=Nostoc sp. LPT TaxID=2815387 RepID=UPI001D39FE5B|nr:hypothetical protein [Nostoc sp. LPT]MBN4003009.1 hypothetical protein [Nostoc sp. LPT]